MIIKLLQIILIFTIFIIDRYVVNKWVNQKNYPKWLDYRPWNCQQCCTFWSLLAIYLTVGLVFNLWWTMIGGMILSLLNAIAMKIDQKNKTIKIEDYDNIEQRH